MKNVWGSRLRACSIAAVAATVASLATATDAQAAGPPAAFVQQASGHTLTKASLSVTPTSAVISGNRLVVEVVVWNSAKATAKTLADSSGDTFTKLLSQVASDGTELSVWTAPITTGGVKPVITATPTSSADVGIVAAEYSGLSTAAGAGAVDTQVVATGKTTAAGAVSSGNTTATAATNELAVGFYGDSGFGKALTAGAGYTQRANVSPVNDAQMLVEDQTLGAAGATPAATVGTGASIPWLMATVVFAVTGGGTTPPPTPTAPGAPTAVVAGAGDSTATVSWQAPASNGSAITNYTVTPYAGSTAGTPLVVSGNPPVTTASFSGLTNGTSYTFQVTATNGVGTGPSASSNTVVPQTQNGGTMTPLQTWPIAALANQLLYTGKVVAWDGWQQPQPTVFGDPTDPASLTTINAPDSVFCDGGATLPDGRLLVIGGYGSLTTGQLGIVDTNIFDPSTNTWQRVADMKNPRWYPTLTELSDGRYLALSGNSTDMNTWADNPEVYDPKSNSWTTLTRVNTSNVREVEYPFTYEMPNGKIFVIGPEEDSSQIIDVDAQTQTSTGSTGFFNGSSVMYRPGKILYSGGAARIDATSSAYATAATIDTTAPSPKWTRVAPMNHSRIYHTLTMLADGSVFAAGGADTADQQVIKTGVLPTEIWDPNTQTWTDTAPISTARNYHSTAVLMPDGRVMIAGGGHSTGLQDAGQYSAQFYSPPYLSQGTRPTITSAPGLASYGSTFSVTSPDASSITGVNLVSLGADTHQIDMNQHFVPLDYTASGNSLSIKAPSSGGYAPPGFYMLFVLKNGVPSVAKMIQVGPTGMFTAPGAPGGVTAGAVNASAHVSWNAPDDTGNSPVTGYTVTPYAGTTALASTTVTGNPPATSATITGLTNGTDYTFKVTATNAAGTGVGATSNKITPSTTPPPVFVQSKTGVSANATSQAVTVPAPVTSGDRMIVQVGVWDNARDKATGVTDSAGNTYTEVSTNVASDGAEQSVWTAPIAAGGGAALTVTARASGSADVGVAALEYSGLSAASGADAVDVAVSGNGTTSGAGTISSGATPAATTNDLAVGFYADSGFSSQLTPGSGWKQRANFSPDNRMEIAAEDQSLASGSTATATFGSSAKTVAQATVVAFKGVGAPASAPATPSNVTALPGNRSATVSWSTPANNGSPISGYTVTPYLAGVAQTPLPAAAGANSLIVSGLTNGSSYNFTVTATNALGSSAESTLSNTVVPTAATGPQFVQSANARIANKATVTVAPTSAITAGNRLIAEVGVWSGSKATASAVSDSAGDKYTELLHFTASDNTEMSIWSAPITAGGGSKPTLSVTATGNADIGVGLSEYSGLAASSPVDVSATASGTTTTAQPVSSGLTAMTSGGTELAVGFYVDSGFSANLSSDSGYQARVVTPSNGVMELLSEDAPVTAGATPSPSINTGARTVWLAATVVFRAG